METSYLWWCFISFFSAHLFNLFWVSLTFPSTAILCLCSSIWPWMNDNAIQILTSCTLGIAESPLLKEKKWEKTTTIQCWLFFLWVYYLCHVNSENFQRCHFVKQVCVCVFFCDCLTSGHWFNWQGKSYWCLMDSIKWLIGSASWKAPAEGVVVVRADG